MAPGAHAHIYIYIRVFSVLHQQRPGQGYPLVSSELAPSTTQPTRDVARKMLLEGLLILDY